MLNKIIWLLTEQQPISSILYYLGILSFIYYGIVYILRLYKSIQSTTKLSKELALYKSKDKRSRPNILLVCMDEVADSLTTLLTRLSKRNFNVIAVLNKQLVNSIEIDKTLSHLNQSDHAKHCAVYFSDTHNLAERLEKLEHMVKENEAHMLITFNTEHKLNRSTESFILTTKDIEHIDLKIKLMTLMITCFVKANKDNLDNCFVLTNNLRVEEKKDEFSMWDSFQFYLESVKNELPQLKVKYFNDI